MHSSINRSKKDANPIEWYATLTDHQKNLNETWANAQAIDWGYIGKLNKDDNIREVYEAFLQHREDLIRKTLGL
ncbi:MAG: hypothetical protein HEQ32_02440 [Vampirovibrio sp.]